MKRIIIIILVIIILFISLINTTKFEKFENKCDKEQPEIVNNAGQYCIDKKCYTNFRDLYDYLYELYDRDPNCLQKFIKKYGNRVIWILQNLIQIV